MIDILLLMYVIISYPIGFCIATYIASDIDPATQIEPDSLSPGCMLVFLTGFSPVMVILGVILVVGYLISLGSNRYIAWIKHNKQNFPQNIIKHLFKN